MTYAQQGAQPAAPGRRHVPLSISSFYSKFITQIVKGETTNARMINVFLLIEEITTNQKKKGSKRAIIYILAKSKREAHTA